MKLTEHPIRAKPERTRPNPFKDSQHSVPLFSHATAAAVSALITASFRLNASWIGAVCAASLCAVWGAEKFPGVCRTCFRPHAQTERFPLQTVEDEQVALNTEGVPPSLSRSLSSLHLFGQYTLAVLHYCKDWNTSISVLTGTIHTNALPPPSPG